MYNRKMAWRMKRTLAGLLAAGLVLTGMPTSVVEAANVTLEEQQLPEEGGNASQEGTDETEESGTDVETDSPGENGNHADVNAPGDGEGVSDADQPGDGENTSDTGQPGDGENASDENTPGEEDKEEQNPEDPGADKDTDTSKPGAEDPDREEKDSDEEKDVTKGDVSVEASHYNVQVSGNDLMSILEEKPKESIISAELEGVYQFGDAPSAKRGRSAYSAADYSEAEEYIYQEMLKRNEEIDVSSYNIPFDNGGKTIGLVASGVLNEHPDLYFVTKQFRLGYIGDKVTTLLVTYSDGYDDAAFQKEVKAALSTVNGVTSELEKAIILHDYLVLSCEYDYQNYLDGTVPDVSHSAYGPLVNHVSVCDGYALAYKYLLKHVGIECYMVTSDAIHHAWNLIELDGQYYQVDLTWDDPTWDRLGRVNHNYMFRSDAAFDEEGNSEEGHIGGVVTRGSKVVDLKAVDTRYDSAFWTDCSSPLVFAGDACYYTAFDESS